MTGPARRSARILRNTVSNSLGRAVSVATTFFLTPFILHSLGETAFGLWVLAQVVVSYGSLLDLGMGSAIIKYVAEVHAKQDSAGAHRLLATATRLYLALAVVALAIGLTVATQAYRVVDLSRGDERSLTAVLAIVTVGFSINLAATPATATLRGLQRYDITNVLTVSNVLANAALTILVLSRGGDVVAMVAVTVPVALVTQVVAITVVRRLHPAFALRWSPGSRATARRLTTFGLTLTVGQLALLLQKKSSEIIVGTMLAVSAVTPYALAQRLSELPHVISDQFIKVLLPVASELNASGDSAPLRQLYLVSTRITLALMLPLALCAAVLAGDLLELWVGAEYRDNAALVVVLVLASVALTSQWPAGSVLQGMDRFGPVAVAALVSGVANVILTIALVGPYGLMGVALGTLVPTVAEAFLFVLPFTLRALHVPFRQLVTHVAAPVLLPVAPCVLVLLLTQRLVPGPTWLGVIASGLLAVAVYQAVYLLMPIASQERALVTRRLRAHTRRGR
ncbi:MAG TPA: oligosaccharide flippase family protein [Nocardioidaceae bacterium]|nr:oligosaccharide flippase family protein [Nocardioidaceae bacterium]